MDDDHSCCGVSAAAGGGESGAVKGVTKESLSWAASQMRAATLESSAESPDFCDSSGKCINNLSGKSEGVYGDGRKIGGGRIDKDKLCGVVTCWEQEDGTVRLTDGKDENGQDKSITWEEIIRRNPKIESPLGGLQGYIAKLLGVEYKPGGIVDKVVEAYAGPHDTLNSGYWYGKDGNVRKGCRVRKRR